MFRDLTDAGNTVNLPKNRKGQIWWDINVIFLLCKNKLHLNCGALLTESFLRYLEIPEISEQWKADMHRDIGIRDVRII